LVPATAAWIVVAKTVDDKVPDRAKMVYQQGLAKRNPNVINRQISTKETAYCKVFGLFDGFAVFGDALSLLQI
jgi:hypothetical protein